MSLKIGIIGGGQMSTALTTGIVTSGLTPAANVSVSDINKSSLDTLSAKVRGIKTTTNNAECITGVDVIIIAVKPQYAAACLAPLINVQSNQIVLSIMGGITLAQLTSMLKGKGKIVRAMPNTPALIGKGATGYCFTPGGNVTEKDAAIVEKVLSSVGTVVCIPESLINTLTAVSGCGPAYVFMFIEALADAGTRGGLPRATAQQLAAQTVMGSGALVLSSGQHPGQLKDNVCSPGGITIEGVAALERLGFRGTVIQGCEAAARRADEMSRPPASKL